MEQNNIGATMQQPQARRRSKLPLVLLLIVLLLAGAYGALCAYAGSLNVFYPNRHINGIDVGGLSAPDAQGKLEREILGKTVTLYDEATGEDLAAVSLTDLGYSAESFAGDAQWWLEQQQAREFFAQGWAYFNIATGRWPGGANWPDFDEETLTSAAGALAEKLEYDPIDASFQLEENAVSVIKAKDGRKLALPLKTVLKAVSEYSQRDYRLGVKFDVLPAKTLTAKAIHDAIHGELKNASYDIETDTILPESTGADFDVSTAQGLLDKAESGEAVSIPAVIEFPEVTAAQLQELLFRDVLGECKTQVSGTAARRTNVRLAAEKVNGYVMNHGDVFSYNEVVGQRTAEAGFQPAPAYIHGETVDEIGGGICQVSSTLYYACLRGDLSITQRLAHRYVPAYIDWGMDATVSWGGPDYKFTNDTLYPIRIETSYVNNTLTVRVVGTNLTGKYAKMTNEVLGKTDWETEYKEDPTIAPGTQSVKTSPYTGYQVKSYRHVYDKDGNLISSAFEASSNYKHRNQVILVAPGELPGQEKVPPVVTPPEEAPETPEVDVPPVETPPEEEQPPVEVPPVEETPTQEPPPQEATAPEASLEETPAAGQETPPSEEALQ